MCRGDLFRGDLTPESMWVFLTIASKPQLGRFKLLEEVNKKIEEDRRPHKAKDFFKRSFWYFVITLGQSPPSTSRLASITANVPTLGPTGKLLLSLSRLGFALEAPACPFMGMSGTSPTHGELVLVWDTQCGTTLPEAIQGIKLKQLRGSDRGQVWHLTSTQGLCMRTFWATQPICPSFSCLTWTVHFLKVDAQSLHLQESYGQKDGAPKCRA